MNRRTLLALGGVVAVVVVALLSVVAFSGGSSSPSDTAKPSGSSTPTPGTGAEIAAVRVTGDALPPLTNDVEGDVAVGLTAPALSGVGFDGAPISISPSDGPTLVVFFAHWCSHCNVELPRLRQWFDKGGVPADLNVVGVSSAAQENQPNWPPSQWATDTMRWPWPVLVDSPVNDALMAYGVTSFPSMVLLDAEGKVLGRTTGEVPLEVFEAWVSDLLDA